MRKNVCNVKFSNSYLAKMKRIKNLPKEAIDMMKSTLYRDGMNIIKNFKTGIKTNAFGLEALANGTILRKQRLGNERPTTPLYGKGDEKGKNSYVNMLRIKKIAGGYMVYPSKAKHYSGKIELNRLWKVHELGTTINTEKAVIRIPARPALLMAVRKMVLKRNVKKDAKVMKKAIQKYVMTGNKSVFNSTAKTFTKGIR